MSCPLGTTSQTVCPLLYWSLVVAAIHETLHQSSKSIILIILEHIVPTSSCQAVSLTAAPPRVPPAGERGPPLLLPLHPGPEDGHPAARRWRLGGEGRQADEEMWTEHFGHAGSESVWHAGASPSRHPVEQESNTLLPHTFQLSSFLRCTSWTRVTTSAETSTTAAACRSTASARRSTSTCTTGRLWGRTSLSRCSTSCAAWKPYWRGRRPTASTRPRCSSSMRDRWEREGGEEQHFQCSSLQYKVNISNILTMYSCNLQGFPFNGVNHTRCHFSQIPS